MPCRQTREGQHNTYNVIQYNRVVGICVKYYNILLMTLFSRLKLVPIMLINDGLAGVTKLNRLHSMQINHAY